MPDEVSERSQQKDETIGHLHVDDAPWCEWCEVDFVDGESIQTIQWELGESAIIALFCSESCAEKWADAVEMKPTKVEMVHV